jgi:hypothetical protein
MQPATQKQAALRRGRMIAEIDGFAKSGSDEISTNTGIWQESIEPPKKAGG